jgi:hypothetical protein
MKITFVLGKLAPSDPRPRETSALERASLYPLQFYQLVVFFEVFSFHLGASTSVQLQEDATLTSMFNLEKGQISMGFFPFGLLPKGAEADYRL